MYGQEINISMVYEEKQSKELFLSNDTQYVFPYKFYSVLNFKRFNFQLIVVWFFFSGNKSSSATGRRGKAFRTNNSRNRIFPPPPNVQETNFDCANYEFPGLYADTEANCEVSDIIFSNVFGRVMSKYNNTRVSQVTENKKS